MAYVYPFKKTDEKTKLSVWLKGTPIPNQSGTSFDPKIWRFDACGIPIKYTDHGDVNSKYGWEIDHKVPLSKDGPNILSNLQPLHWENNRSKGDTYPWSCP